MNKMNIKKGDTVVVLAGNDKGKKGKVLKAFPAKERVIVENVNIMKKHERPSQKNQQGGIVEREASIHVSNVKLFNPKSGQVTRPVIAIHGEKRVRIDKKTGEEI